MTTPLMRVAISRDRSPAPSSVNVAQVEQAIRDVDTALAPEGDKATAVWLTTLLEWGSAFGKIGSEEQGAALVTQYREALSHIPARYLMAAVTRLKETWSWPRMPDIAEVRKAIPSEYRELLRAKSRLPEILAEVKEREVNPPPTNDERREMARRLRQLIGKGSG